MLKLKITNPKMYKLKLITTFQEQTQTIIQQGLNASVSNKTLVIGNGANINGSGLEINE